MSNNEKVLAKMLANGVITNAEFDSGKVSNDRVQMFIRGIVPVTERKTISSEIEYHEKKKQESNSAGLLIDEKRYGKILVKLKQMEKVGAAALSQASPERSFGSGKVVEGAKTQNEAVKMHMEQHGHITSMEAFELYGITRLSARVFELRWDKGLEIDAETVSGTNRFGHSMSYSKYSLKS